MKEVVLNDNLFEVTHESYRLYDKLIAYGKSKVEAENESDVFFKKYIEDYEAWEEYLKANPIRK